MNRIHPGCFGHNHASIQPPLSAGGRLRSGLHGILRTELGLGFLGDELMHQNAARQVTSVRQFHVKLRVLLTGLDFAAVVAVVGCSLPGTAAMALLIG